MYFNCNGAPSLYGKGNVLRECNWANISPMCALGYPPSTYTQNAKECMNRVIKSKSKRAYMETNNMAEWTMFRKLRKEVKRQRKIEILSINQKLAGTMSTVKQY